MALGMVAAGISIGSSLRGRRKQKKAGKSAQKLADQDAARIKEETDEAVRRTGESQEDVLARSRAISGGSGIRSGAGSTDVYMDEMKKTFKADLDWIEKSGASQESLTRAQGRFARQESDARSWGTVATGVSQALSWWK